MKTCKRMLSGLLALAMLLSMAAVMTGCGGNGTAAQETTAAAQSGEMGNYTVTIETKGGMAMSELDVYVYADDTLSDLKQYGQTDENGTVSFQMEKNDSYAIQISGAPKGYQVASSYSFTGNTANVVLESQLITGESLSGASLGLGDVMYDFNVTTPDGEIITLSEMLSQKKMVLLNFWYTTCTYCVKEFPYMQEAYEQYSDDVGIIAVDPLEEDAAIASFQAQYGLTFPMAKCAPAWSTTFGISGYPTSIIIDRYGVITLIEVGGITSLRPFISLFETMTADDYQQKLYGSIGEMVTRIKPTFTMDTTENIGAVLNEGEVPVSFRGEADDEYSWPFIAAEKNGETCLKASNQQIDGAYAILYMDVELKAGQAVGFDYLASCENGNDVMHVIVNDEPIYTITGLSEVEEWKSCYPWVAETDGTYEVALCYIKDDSDSQGDDTVYIKDLCVVDAAEVDVETYIPRYAATSEDGFDYSYVDIVLNTEDGFYHVGSEDGPLLLADLMNTTQFNEEETVWFMVDEGRIVKDGHNYYEELVDYCSLSSRSSLSGICPVNEELCELLKIVAEVAGFEDDENEWLKICKYFQAYGSDGEQLVNPILGLATFCPLEAKLGKNIPTNSFTYDRPLLPRGMMAEFIPATSGAYRITTRANSVAGVEGWVFNDQMEQIYVYESAERMYNDTDNISMVLYMEAGKSYYIDICFWDMYETGTIEYDSEPLCCYLLCRACAPGFFTYDSDATGDAMYYLITLGIDIVLGEDGYYYEDLGNGKKGSAIYVDFVGTTGVFSTPVTTVPSYNADGTVAKDAEGNPIMITGMIDMGGFDFSKNENDDYVCSFLKQFDYDVEATDAHLREMWGADYDAYAEIYQLEDVYEGKYHGKGEDLTEEIRSYVDKMEKGPKEREGCVKVDKRLAEILQMAMDKFTFENVENSWLKMCYYYETFGPKA